MHGISEQTIINYQSGYNSGISYADSRVNTSSSSYTTGYNNGYSNGKNILSTLTSGEKAFIGLLFTPICSEFSSYGFRTIIGGKVTEERYPDGSGGYEVYHAYLDLSKITNVNIFFDSNYGNELYWVDANCENIATIYNYNNVQVPSGAKGLKIGSARNANFRITSFTTTDGKVHTADNLNY